MDRGSQRGEEATRSKDRGIDPKRLGPREPRRPLCPRTVIPRASKFTPWHNRRVPTSAGYIWQLLPATLTPCATLLSVCIYPSIRLSLFHPVGDPIAGYTRDNRERSRTLNAQALCQRWDVSLHFSWARLTSLIGQEPRVSEKRVMKIGILLLLCQPCEFSVTGELSSIENQSYDRSERCIESW